MYEFIAVEGNIGSGKTTLAKKMALDYNANLILESFARNPFLPKFYKDPNKYAFPLELFFMAERYQQLNKQNKDLFSEKIISDYFFVKSQLFAKNNLTNDEFSLFNRLFNIMFSSLRKPDIVVYLYANIHRLQLNIKKRGREFEQSITDSYLKDIQSTYLDYFRKQSEIPVLVIDVSDVDFVKSKHHYDKIKKVLNLKYDKGIHYLNLLSYSQ